MKGDTRRTDPKPYTLGIILGDARSLDGSSHGPSGPVWIGLALTAIIKGFRV